MQQYLRYSKTLSILPGRTRDDPNHYACRHVSLTDVRLDSQDIMHECFNPITPRVFAVPPVIGTTCVRCLVAMLNIHVHGIIDSVMLGNMKQNKAQYSKTTKNPSKQL